MMPSAKNPRAMPPENLERLRESLRVFGDLGAVVYNRRTGRLVCGHQRREALAGLDLGAVKWGRATAVTLGYSERRFESRERWGEAKLPDGARVTVREVDWPAAFEKGANVAANNPALQGEWAAEELQKILAEVAEDAGALGFAALVESVRNEAKPDKDGSADSAPEAPENPESRAGEVYALGDHRLVCGDATAPEVLRAALEAQPADAVFTDPPYNMNYRSKATGGIKNDALSEAEFVRLILSSTACWRDALKDGGAFYVCMSGAAYAAVAAQLRKLGLEHRPIVWVKNFLGLGAQDYRPMFELVLYGFCGKRSERLWRAGRREADVWEFSASRDVAAFETPDGGMALEFGAGLETLRVVLDRPVPGKVISFDGEVSDVWRFKRESGGRYVHPTQKPVALVERAIKNSTRAGEIVLDPFAGSGSTVIAAERLGRRVAAVELDPRYCDVIRKRWAEYVHGPGCDWLTLTPAT